MSKVAKKVFLCTAIALMAVSLPIASAPAYASTEVAIGSSQTIFVDGRLVPMTAYNINGNNYVCLREVGHVINFEVTYAASDDSVRIFTGEPYSGELTMPGQDQERVEAAMSRQAIYVDGVVAPMLAYTVCGNNYVKLRDIGVAVGFSVEWDALRSCITIDTGCRYGETTAMPTDNTAYPVPAMSLYEMKMELIRLTNIERIKLGLAGLEDLPELMECAQLKADDMLENHYFGHNSPIYGSANDMVRRLVPGYKGACENINIGAAAPAEVVAGWLESEEHYINLTNPRVTHIGVGIAANSSGALVWVLQLMRR